MKTVRILSLIVLTLLVFSLNGCFNPAMDLWENPAESEQNDETPAVTGETGTLSVSLLIPDYDAAHPKTGDAKSKIIDPKTYAIYIYLDGEYFTTLITTSSYDFEIHNSYFGELYRTNLTVAAKTYSIGVSMYDSFGNALTYGSAYDITVPAGGTAQAYIYNYPYYYTMLYMNDSPVYGTVQAGRMTYFSFYAEQGGSYRVTLTPGAVYQDFYLFSPDAVRTGTTYGVDYSYTDNGDRSIEKTLSAPGYYYVGVYGGGGDGDFTINVEEVTSGVYYITNAYGEPWSDTTNFDALNTAFGSEGYNVRYFDSLNAEEIFSPETLFVFIDGSESSYGLFEYFVNSNISIMENWVAEGGRLFINAAPQVDNNLYCGFESYIYSRVYADNVIAWESAHPIFENYIPVGYEYTGYSYAHAVVTGTGLSPILVDNDDTSNVVLAEKSWGQGKFMIGGMTTTTNHQPLPDATNLRANMFSYMAQQ